MRASPSLVTLLGFLGTLLLGYFAYSISAGIHPGSGAPASPTTAPSAAASH